MPNENILAEREFDIPIEDENYKVKATAVFLVHGFDFEPSGMKQRGVYFLNFTFGGQQAELWQPDKTYYSREQAERAAESAFTSGQVEAYARNQIQTWIHLGL